MSDESSPALPTTPNDEAEEDDSRTDAISRAISVVLSLSLAVPAIVVASKHLNDEASACRKDAAWLLVFGIDLMLFDVILERNKFPGTLSSLYTFGWSIYGVVLFAKPESAEQCDPRLHDFGYGVAVSGVVACSIFGCFCGCTIIIAILGGGSRASATDEGADVV